MAYYVDLNLDTNPSYLPDSTAQPMGWYDMSANYSLYTFKMKGERDSTADFGFGGGAYMRMYPWEDATAPWRLKLGSMTWAQDGVAYIYGGILDAISITFYAPTLGAALVMNNAILSCDSMTAYTIFGGIAFDTSGAVVDVRTSTTITSSYGIGIYLKMADTAFISGNWTGANCLDAGVSPGILNCVFSANQPSGTVTITDSTFNWNAPTMPTWNAPQSSYKTRELFKGIHAIPTPPEPGNPPYTGYATDLWGNPRLGIGTGWMAPLPISLFDSSVVADGSSVSSTMYRSVLVNRIQANSADPYFDSTSKINEALVYYYSDDTRQYQWALFEGDPMRATFTWQPGAKDGTWAKSRIFAIGHNNEKALVTDATDEALTHSGGMTYLNT